MNVVPSKEPKAAAERRMQHACNFAVIIGLLRLLLGAIALTSERRTQDGLFMGIGMIIDALICFGLAYGLYRKSRVVALLLLAYVLATQLITFFIVPPAGSGITAIIITVVGLVLAIRAVPAAFRYHALTREQTDARTNAT